MAGQAHCSAEEYLGREWIQPGKCEVVLSGLKPLWSAARDLDSSDYSSTQYRIRERVATTEIGSWQFIGPVPCKAWHFTLIEIDGGSQGTP